MLLKAALVLAICGTVLAITELGTTSCNGSAFIYGITDTGPTLLWLGHSGVFFEAKTVPLDEFRDVHNPALACHAAADDEWLVLIHGGYLNGQRVNDTAEVSIWQQYDGEFNVKWRYLNAPSPPTGETRLAWFTADGDLFNVIEGDCDEDERTLTHASLNMTERIGWEYLEMHANVSSVFSCQSVDDEESDIEIDAAAVDDEATQDILEDEAHAADDGIDDEDDAELEADRAELETDQGMANSTSENGQAGDESATDEERTLFADDDLLNGVYETEQP
jgi:hypothetical protein